MSSGKPIWVIEIRKTPRHKWTLYGLPPYRREKDAMALARDYTRMYQAEYRAWPYVPKEQK